MTPKRGKIYSNLYLCWKNKRIEEKMKRNGNCDTCSIVGLSFQSHQIREMFN